jgi:nicotinamidase-related amidase
VLTSDMTTALLLIDVQRNMFAPPEPVANAEAVSAAIADLLARARAAGAPVVHVRNNGDDEQDPDFPGTEGWELAYEVRAGEPVVDKTVCDSFEGTDLAALLPADAALVVAGMQTDWCIRATTLAALQRGHRVTLAAGAHSTLPDDRTVPAIITAVEQELAKAGAEVVPAGSITFG